ncbi:hypothetical protein B0T10DRAFT_455812 [Thelonectria olida]|uniref:NDT80 domain-containing protein n=1 Tax=Thelonectria olida TaxID=1576542 RepID=A0A9P8WCH3_9HYPO|nr:hypothetical protein B0T10DRAFT_455812 [Thelonectria olida]
MAHHPHPHRTTALPHPGPQISTREQYTPATPSFRRASEHPSRSPSFTGSTLRRNPVSPTPSPIQAFPATGASMGSSQFNNRGTGAHTIPPLMPITMFGSLQYQDGAATPAKVDINGTIDKGFFLSDNEWTCYRRNYFSCGCSFSLSPYMPGTAIQFTSTDSKVCTIYGFAVSISAVVSDNETHSIELVQHTPKRDKGPIINPEKVRLGVKPPQPHGHHLDMYPSSVGGRYTDSFNAQPGSQSHPTEHTFERIQFKQATQNNGKRRAAQQYYQLVVELWGDTGPQGDGQSHYVKIATRKSAKMIVRGRSPGHYQNDRRGSQSSGPGGHAGSMSSYVTGGATMNDFNPGTIMGPTYAPGFDGRGNVYNVRHHDIPHESMISNGDAKAIDTTKEYQYYPGPLYEGERIDLFSPRTESEASTVPHMAAGAAGVEVNGKVKHEYDGATLPSIFHPPPQVVDRRPGPFEGKPTSQNYYPTMASAPGINMTIS